MKKDGPSDIIWAEEVTIVKEVAMLYTDLEIDSNDWTAEVPKFCSFEIHTSFSSIKSSEHFLQIPRLYSELYSKHSMQDSSLHL